MSDSDIKKYNRQTFHYEKQGLEEEEDILLSHLGLVFSISKKYKNIKTNRISYEDIVQEGILGLCEAFSKFDQSQGSNFYYFAKSYIENNIKIYLRKNSNILYVPQKTLWKIYRYKKYKEKNPEEDDNGIKENLGLSKKEIEMISLFSSSCEISYIKNFLYEKDTISELSEKSKELFSLLSSLSDFEKEILNMRDVSGMSWRNMGVKMGISHEAARKKYNKIVKKLRENSFFIEKGISL